jgi:hypothetical protein
LTLIARRTGKPISYFKPQLVSAAEADPDLAIELGRIAERVRHFITSSRLNKFEGEAMKLVELALRQGAELTRSLQTTPRRESKRYGSSGRTALTKGSR